MMKSLLFSGIATATLAFAAMPAAASDSFVPTPQSATSPNLIKLDLNMSANGAKRGNMHRWGQRIDGRWHGGYGAPGGWKAYRPAFRGYIMPRYWINPSFLIGNYSLYRLRAPSTGYNWYRYYDDAVLSDNKGYVYDTVSNVSWDQHEGGYAPDGHEEAEYGPAIEADNQAYNWNDNGTVAFAAPDGSRYSYDGDWQGKYVDSDGRVFEGHWDGRVTRHDGADAAIVHAAPPMPHHAIAPLAPPAHVEIHQEREVHHAPPAHVDVHQQHGDQYAIPRGYEGYEKCLRSSGATGAVIGAILGGVAGNRIGGSGNRLAGTLIGTGLGGISGAVIEQAASKCKKFNPDNVRRPVAHPYPQQPYPYPQQGWTGGYYYYPQAVTTVTVYPGTTTTTVTEEVVYESVATSSRKKVVRKYRPKVVTKPKCQCR